MAIASSESVPKATSKKPGRTWFPHVWEGCTFGTWMRVLFRHRCRVHWSCWHIAIVTTVLSVIHTMLWAIQWLIFGRRIRNTQLVKPPIFILGHWRTGTTLLHELLVRDKRHTF